MCGTELYSPGKRGPPEFSTIRRDDDSPSALARSTVIPISRFSTVRAVQTA